MAKFHSKLVISPVGEHRLWITECPFVVETLAAGIVTVPAGFLFDGNSLPRLMWWYSLPTDFLEAGCLHDYLYRYGRDRKVADQAYTEVLELQGQNKVSRGLRYTALRLFGGIAFKKDQAGELKPV